MMEPITLVFVLQTCKFGGTQGWQTHQMIAPSMIAFLRPKISEMKPEHKAASHDPPAMEAVIPPWTLALGPWHWLGSVVGGPWLK